MADTNRADFDFLLRVAKRSIARLRADAISATGNRAHALGEHLERTLATLEERIEISEGRVDKSDDLDRVTVLHTMRGVNRFLEEMQEAADWIGKSHASELHLGTLYFIDQLSTGLIGPGVRVPSIPDGRYGYSSLSWPFKHILEEYKVQDPTAGPHPAVITYPPHEGNSTLLTALFAHEIAHATVEEEALVLGALEATTNLFDKTFESLAEELARERAEPLSEIEDKLREQVTSWITELLCDSFATHYLGPSYLFAFAPMVIATGLDQFSGSHPPTATRVRHILSALNRGGWVRVLEREVPGILEWLTAIGDIAPQPTNDHESLCLETCALFQEKIFEVVSEHLKGIVFEVSEFEGEKSKVLMEFFDQRVLPAQLPDESAADRHSILLAAWLFKLRADHVEDIALALDDDEFQAFLAAAFEMSFVLEAWKSK